MENKINTTKFGTFDSIKHLNGADEEYWYARELMSTLGYETWESFHKVIKKAQTSMLKIYPQIEGHFREVTKMSKIAAGRSNEAMRPTVDYKLTRYACYLIAQNGDPRKETIALAQSYFATQTRKRELETEKSHIIERIKARRKLKETEKKFSGVLSSKGLTSSDIAEVRSVGDQALFNMPTRVIKNKLNIKTGSLADHLPTITIKAKDLATEITTFNTLSKDLRTKPNIKAEHKENNFSVRKLLNEKGIFPEQLPAEIDIQRLERRISEKEILKKKTNDFIAFTELIINLINVIEAEEILRIRDIIRENPGDIPLKVIFGSNKNKKMLTRNISLSSELINSLRKYIVIEKNS
ncbi:MAG: DNA damage-inducible protein D [Candidatus Dojkabacteria bacterium]